MTILSSPGRALPIDRGGRLPGLHHRARHRQVHHLRHPLRTLRRQIEILDLSQPHRGRRVLRVIQVILLTV